MDEYNMKVATVLFCLCLLAGTQAATISLNRPYVFKSLTNSATDGAGVSLPSTTQIYDSMPCNDFLFWSWAKISAGTDDGAKILKIVGKEGKTFFVQWKAAEEMKFTLDGTEHPVAGTVTAPTRQEDKWVFIAMGVNVDTAYGILILRSPTDSVFTVSWTGTMEIEATSTFMGPADTMIFNVRSK